MYEKKVIYIKYYIYKIFFTFFTSKSNLLITDYLITSA